MFKFGIIKHNIGQKTLLLTNLVDYKIYLKKNLVDEFKNVEILYIDNVDLNSQFYICNKSILPNLKKVYFFNSPIDYQDTDYLATKELYVKESSIGEIFKRLYPKSNINLLNYQIINSLQNDLFDVIYIENKIDN